jgi:DNA-directed RNA polymerase subunit L
MGIAYTMPAPLLVGNENLSAILRCLTSIEMHENASYYANHPLIKSLQNTLDIVMCLSNAAYSVFETNGEIAAVLKEAKQNALNYECIP